MSYNWFLSFTADNNHLDFIAGWNCCCCCFVAREKGGLEEYPISHCQIHVASYAQMTTGSTQTVPSHRKFGSDFAQSVRWLIVCVRGEVAIVWEIRCSKARQVSPRFQLCSAASREVLLSFSVFEKLLTKSWNFSMALTRAGYRSHRN